MDVYQRIESQVTIKNDRARLLLRFLRSQPAACFWDFQDALAETTCADIAVKRENELSAAAIFSAEELTAASYSAWEQGRPATVVKVNRKLKELYRDLKMRSLDGHADSDPVSLDEIHVNISLLSSDKLDALCGSPGQRQPFAVRSLETKESSVVSLEDMFKKGGKGREEGLQMAAGIAGSGKSTAFMLKAPFEWSKEDRDRAFWGNFGLFFLGSLNDPSWWQADDLAKVFGLSRYGLTTREEEEVVRYICDHSNEVLLVADSLDEAEVNTRSLLWRILCGKCQDVPKLHVIICSRPCEKTLWMSKHCLFRRRLEVVGFTDEKIGQFVTASSPRNHKRRVVFGHSWPFAPTSIP